MKKIKRGSGILSEFIEERLNLINPCEVKISILSEIKTFIDEAIIKEKRPLFVFTDYDVDGITSCVLAVKLFNEVYPEAELYYRTPKRISEGYGFNLKILEEVPENAMLITIDNGIVAFDSIKAAKEKGCKVVVIDHHLGKEDGSLPDADYLLDPNAIPGQSDFSEFCGCGLIYKLSQLYDLSESLEKELRGIAALATIADCVPLTGENWKIAKDLRYALINKGISYLADLFEIYDFNEGDAGFKICPALNAPGRLLDDGAMKAVEALLINPETAKELVDLNSQRKELTEQFFEEAIKLISENGLDKKSAIAVVTSAPEGLVGIIAGRIAEKYMRPAFVFTRTEEGFLKGSARSYGSNHLKKMLDDASELLIKYGGHAAAAGLSIEEENFAEFEKTMDKLSIKDEDDTVFYDLTLSPYNIKDSIRISLNELDEIAPFGEGNPEPLFYIENVRLFPRGSNTYRLMGSEQQHIKLYGKDFDIVWFGGASTYLEKPWSKINVIGKIGVNHFGGKDYYQVEAVYVEEAKPSLKETNLQNLLNKRAKERYV